eukprot:PhM_4_TR18034/c0_g1_i1/m.1424/K18533/AK9; adenylate/nucleoside-diphosphate kinase
MTDEVPPPAPVVQYPAPQFALRSTWDGVELDVATLWSALDASAAVTQSTFDTFFSCVYIAGHLNARTLMARSMASSEWPLATLATGSFDNSAFKRFLRRLYKLFGCPQKVSFSDFLSDLRKCILTDDGKLRDPEDVGHLRTAHDVGDTYAIADCCDDSEDEHENLERRIVIIGPPEANQGAVAAAMAEATGARNISAFELCLAAVDRAEADELGTKLRAHVDACEAIPLDLQSAVVARELGKPSVIHSGYVLHEFPLVGTAADGATTLTRYINEINLSQCLPNTVIKLTTVDDELWCMQARKQHDDARQAELKLRQDQADTAERHAAEKLQREERRRAYAERRAKIDAGEIEATADDEEGPPAEEEPELDEDGNPLSEEAVLAKATEEKAVEDRRRFVADLAHCIWLGRDVAKAGDVVLPERMPFFQPIIQRAQARGAYATFFHQEPPKDIVSAACDLFDILGRVPVPYFPPQEEGEEESKDAETMLNLLRAQNDYSSWGKYCPVVHHLHGVLIEGSGLYGCIYRGKVYTMATREYYDLFVASPETYMRRTGTTGPRRVMLLKEELESLAKGVEEVALATSLANRWKLTPVCMKDFVETYRGVVEEARRISEEEERLRKEAEEARLEEEKRKAAERKKEKAADKKSGEKKKKAVVEVKEEVVENPPEEEKEKPPPTHEEIVAARIEELKKALEQTPPVLVYETHAVPAEDLKWLHDMKFLPTTLLVPEYKEPVVESQDDDEQEGAVANEAGDEEDAGEKTVPEVPDMSNPFHYKTVVRKFLDQIQSKDEEAAEQTNSGTPVDIRRFNVFGLEVAQIVSQLSQDLDGCAFPIDTETKPPEDADEAEAGDDEEGPKKDPRLVPGKRSTHHFGHTLHYCPVTLAETKLLVAGNPELTIRYRGRFYLFRGEAELAAFKANPTLYMPTYPPEIPPPRVWVLGPSASGKRTLAQSLSQEYKIPILSTEPEKLRALIAGSQGADADAGRAVIAEIDAFDVQQETVKNAKEAKLARIAEREERAANGEDVDDEDEDDDQPGEEALLEWEPEEEDVRAERLMKQWTKVLLHASKCAPYNTQGYIIIGAPTSEAEMELMVSLDLVPELVINVTLTVETYLRRTLRKELESRRDVRNKKLQEIDEKRSSRLAVQRRVELMRWRQRNLDRENDDDAEEEELEEPEEVTEEAVQSDMEARFDEDNTRVASIVAALPDKRIKVYDVAGDRARAGVFRSVMSDLSLHFVSRESLLENPYVVTYSDAIDLLQKGVCFTSSLGTRDAVDSAPWNRTKTPALSFVPTPELNDPVDFPAGTERTPPPPPPKPRGDGDEEEEEPEPPKDDDEEEDEEPLNEEELEELQKAESERVARAALDRQPRCAVTKNHVYFFKSEANLLEFLSNPIRYTTQPLPVPRSNNAVLVFNDDPHVSDDAPKKKNRTLGRHLAHNLGAVHLSIDKLAKWAISTPGHPLGDKMLTNVAKRIPISKTDLCTLLYLRTCCVDVVRAGYVLDDYPTDIEHYTAVLEKGLHFTKVVVGRTRKSGTVEHVIAANKSDRCNVHELPSAYTSLFTDLVDVYTAVRHSQRCRESLLQRCQYGLPCRLYDCSLSSSDYTGRWSAYGVYCPNEWLSKSLLVDTSEMDLVRRYSVEFANVVYNFSSEEHAAAFVRDPYPMLSSSELPTSLPRKVPLSRASSKQLTDFELLGCCPVTLYDTRHRKGLRGTFEPVAVYGQNNFTVEYEGKLYRLVSQVAHTRFLQQPWVYIQAAVLPHPDKLPASDDGTIEMNTERYLQSTVYEIISRGMLDLSTARPKFPQRDAADTALKFLALYLKAHNPKNNNYRTERYTDNFTLFKQCTELYDVATPPSDDADDTTKKMYETKCALWDKVHTLSKDLHEFVGLEEF